MPASRWRTLVRRVARATFRDDAEDLLHSAYVRLQGSTSLGKADDADAYLVRTAVNLGIDEHRRDSRRRQTAEPPGWDQIRDGAPLQDEALVARQKLNEIDRVLAGLGERTRTVFLMHRLDGLKHRDIAARLGISQGMVEKHIARAVLALARAVKP
ncbi:RNA polymerase sigma factor [Brevundimonas sp. GCM10030266]|uniref:RNA polymerase sigma factor n=1 Tax=Brevundimonas sp. GCM10030266 TaxID=3273386 RepID=UPI00360D50A9